MPCSSHTLYLSNSTSDIGVVSGVSNASWVALFCASELCAAVEVEAGKEKGARKPSNPKSVDGPDLDSLPLPCFENRSSHLRRLIAFAIIYFLTSAATALSLQAAALLTPLQRHQRAATSQNRR